MYDQGLITSISAAGCEHLGWKQLSCRRTHIQATYQCQGNGRMEETTAIIGFISHGTFSGGKGIHEPTHEYTGLAKHPTKCCTQFWSPMYQKDKLKIDMQARSH